MQVCHSSVANPVTASAAATATTPVPVSSRGDAVATRRPAIGLAMIDTRAVSSNSNPTVSALAPRCTGKTGSIAESTAAPTVTARTMENDLAP
ncbi:Uncharacterised protein [Arachnia propionica]|nr:Uncharacterised protein [Arachnia propionica]